MITRAQRIERLIRLDQIIHDWPEDRFHMRKFCERATCGTAYFAVGLAAVNRWFQENTEILQLFSINNDDFVVAIYAEDRQLAALFGLNNYDAGSLFGLQMSVYVSEHGVTKAAVRANIARLLRDEHAEPYDVIEAEGIEKYGDPDEPPYLAPEPPAVSAPV